MSVSYTHLDVYKRQWDDRISCAGGGTTIAVKAYIHQQRVVLPQRRNVECTVVVLDGALGGLLVVPV